MGFECIHLRSLAFSPTTTSDITLHDEVLREMVETKWFGEGTMKTCLHRKEMSETMGSSLSKEVCFGENTSLIFLSVFEPRISFSCRLGRVMVHYNKKLNTWHCACCKPTSSCPHKAIAKWHLFQTHPKLFKKVKTTEKEAFDTYTNDADCNDDEQSSDVLYPPQGNLLTQLVKYIQMSKKLPAVLPLDVRAPPRIEDLPSHLIPYETFCAQCPGNVPLSEPILITHKAKIITISGIVQGMCGIKSC